MENSFPDLFPHAKHSMFQFNPELYDWFGWIKENRAEEQWLASRFSKLICLGDKVAIWAAGKESGFYALGETTTYPLKKPLNPDQAKYYHAMDAAGKFQEKPSVIIKYLKVFTGKPITRNVCESHPVLSSLEILNSFTNATNFKLSKAQWCRIIEMGQ